MDTKTAIKQLLHISANRDKFSFIEKTAFIGNWVESLGKRFGTGATSSLKQDIPEMTNTAMDTAKDKLTAPFQGISDKVKDFAGFTRGSMYTIPTAIIGALLMYNMMNKGETTKIGQVGSAFAGATLGTLAGSPAFSRWVQSLKAPKSSPDNFGIA
jgi:phage-related minor tail protein